MAEGDTPPMVHKSGGFLNQTTAGLPNWAWILVIAGGIAAAYFLPKILPSLFGGNQTSGSTGATDASTQTDSGGGLLTVPQGQTPVLPPGLSPLYSPSGNLSAYGYGPVPNTTLPTSQQTMTRGLWSGESDPNGTKTLPIWQNPNVNWQQALGGIPINQSIQVGAPVTGNYFGKTATFYPVSYNGTQGYVGAWDLANPPVASTFPSVQPSSSAWPGNTTQMRIA